MHFILHVLYLSTSLLYVLEDAMTHHPVFPVPSWSNGVEVLAPAFVAIEEKINGLVAHDKFDNSSFSVALTSGSETLWSSFHTARQRNESRPGAEYVDGDSMYRIASITKTFTTLGILYQHEAGNLSLDSPIIDYIPELEGDIPWKDITLRILASQLSGIPREFGQGDLLNEYQDPTAIGLPPASRDSLPSCDEYNGYEPCGRKDFLKRLNQLRPLFAPNQKSTYSNVNFELLGLAIANVTGIPFEDYVKKAIFEPLGMSSSTFDTPPDARAVLPLGNFYWDVDLGIQNPTGGIYSSANDMSKIVRYILNNFNAIATGVNWLMPASWAQGMNSFYGMPFEIFRTDAILKESRRPVTFVTKGGGVPGYFSQINIMEEYGLGLTVLVGGEQSLLAELLNIITVDLIQAAEEAIWQDVGKTYKGTYAAMDPALNSSLELQSSPSEGLVLTSFISNGTDVLNSIPGVPLDFNSGRAQLIPTLLYKNESTQQGEIWRTIGARDRDDGPQHNVLG